MIRRFHGIATFAWLALGAAGAFAAEGDSPAPLAKPGDTYVSLRVDGCENKCASFEIYVFDTGLMKFRSNNKYTSAKGLTYRNGMPGVYRTISKYLEDSGAFTALPECAEKNADTSVASVQSVKDSQTQQASWSSSCPDQRAKGRGVVKVFVNQTGMWKLIHSDMRYWQKYWEDPERTGREDVVQ